MLRVLLLFLVVAGSSVVAQDKLLSVPEEMRNKPWLDREEHLVWNHNVMMVFGEGYKKYRHMNVGKFTTLGYRSPEEIEQGLQARAEKENWDDKTLKEAMAKVKEESPGGALYLYLTRYEESEANTKWYFVIIRDEHDETITRIYLDYQAPEVPEGSGWWNFYEIRIDKPVTFPFYVYLNKNVTGHLSDFKFRVSEVPVEKEDD